MRYDRKEYEIKINESPLFSLNKETQYNAYRKEALKMVFVQDAEHYCVETYAKAVNLSQV